MSTTMHAHVEILLDGEWHLIRQCRSIADIPQNYELFHRIAGVRAESGRGDPIAPSRGFPEDADRATRFLYELHEVDHHSATWLSVEEMATIAEEFASVFEAHRRIYNFEGAFGYLFGNSWPGWVKYPEDRPAGVEGVRCVFWFDC